MANSWQKTLTAGAIRHGNISFRGSPYPISPKFIGGTKAGDPASSTLTVTFSPGSISRQWLYGDKMIFNNRNPHTKDFFERIGAKEGTIIKVTMTSADQMRIEKVD